MSDLDAARMRWSNARQNVYRTERQVDGCKDFLSALAHRSPLLRERDHDEQVARRTEKLARAEEDLATYRAEEQAALDEIRRLRGPVLRSS